MGLALSILGAYVLTVTTLAVVLLILLEWLDV